ncbi:MAG: TIGR00725 family protein [Patescibacteria group bacterium]
MIKDKQKKIQIGVMGSAADLNYSSELEKLAEEVGFCIAKSGCVLMFGAEKDHDSLSTAACRGARRAGGLTVGITYGKGMDIYDSKNADVIIATGLERGGGREMALVLSCDAIICLSGGSGTLTEMLVAYQANIPIVSLKGTGGWSEKLANQYIDARNRVKVELADNPQKAVEIALREINK